MSAFGRMDSQVPLFTYITVPPKSGNVDDAKFDDLPKGIPDHKLQEEDKPKDKVSEERPAPPPTSSRLAEVTAAHERGQCNPCAYFWQKEDGCRQGDNCQFCHMCDRDAMRRWKKEKKQRKKAEALAAEKKAGTGKKKSTTAQKGANTSNTVNTVIGDPVRVNLAECSGLGSSNLGTVFPYLPMELRVTPYQRPPSLDLEKSTTTHADMSPKLVESFTDPGSPISVFTTGETLKAATKDETTTYRPLRLYDMWPELTDNRCKEPIAPSRK